MSRQRAQDKRADAASGQTFAASCTNCNWTATGLPTQDIAERAASAHWTEAHGEGVQTGGRL